MATTITAGNATNGAAVASDNTGILELKTGTGAGTTALTLNASQNATLAGTLSVGAVTSTGLVTGATGALYPLVSDTAKSATSTSVDFTGVPSGVKRITVMFSGVSTSGTSNIQVQLGDSGGIETTGYSGSVGTRGGEVFNSAGFQVTRSQTAATTGSGLITLCLLGSNTFACSGTWSAAATDAPTLFAGAKTLSDTLTQVRITTVNGTDTFDAGTINILYE